jgi:hypothetical protein
MSTGSWLAVLVAGTLAAVVLGRLVALPRRDRPGRPGAVSLLLSVQAGAVVVLGTVVVAAAARSWQLIDRPAQAAADTSLLAVSRIDGDGSMFALLVLFVVPAVVAAAALLLLASRLAASTDPADRSVACAVLAVEIALSGYGLAAAIGGSRSLPALLAVVHLPITMAALVACWPVKDPA